MIFISCVKRITNVLIIDSSVIAPATEVEALKTDSLTGSREFGSATLDPSGFFITINKPGSGAFVSNLCSI